MKPSIKILNAPNEKNLPDQTQEPAVVQETLNIGKRKVPVRLVLVTVIEFGMIILTTRIVLRIGIVGGGLGEVLGGGILLVAGL